MADISTAPDVNLLRQPARAGHFAYRGFVFYFDLFDRRWLFRGYRFATLDEAKQFADRLLLPEK